MAHAYKDELPEIIVTDTVHVSVLPLLSVAVTSIVDTPTFIEAVLLV